MNNTVKIRVSLKSLWWIIPLMVLTHSPAFGGDTQSHESIRKAVETYVLGQMGNTDGDLTVSVGRLDRRLKLRACSLPLEAFFSNNRKNSARKTVGIRCSDGKDWMLYLPVTITLMREVVVAAGELPKKRQLTIDDLIMEKRNIAQLNSGYFKDRALVWVNS